MHFHVEGKLVEATLGLINDGRVVIEKEKDPGCLSYFVLLELYVEIGYKNVNQIWSENPKPRLMKKSCLNLLYVEDDMI